MTLVTTHPIETTQQLLEVAISNTAAVDREAGVLRGVKVLGRTSRNGRQYSQQALEDAARLYEGIGVNIDHPDRRQQESDRKLADRFGTLRNVRITPEGVFADLEFLKTHSLAEQVCEAATRMPNQLGLSHNSEGHVTKSSGQNTVTSITRVLSVDLVQNPATTVGLFEECDPASNDNLPSNGGLLPELQHDDSDHATVQSLREQNEQLRRELEARQLLEAAGLAAHEVRVTALCEAASEPERTRLIGQWARLLQNRPRSASPQTSVPDQRSLPTDARSFARMLR